MGRLVSMTSYASSTLPSGAEALTGMKSKRATLPCGPCSARTNCSSDIVETATPSTAINLSPTFTLPSTSAATPGRTFRTTSRGPCSLKSEVLCFSNSIPSPVGSACSGICQQEVPSRADSMDLCLGNRIVLRPENSQDRRSTEHVPNTSQHSVKVSSCARDSAELFALDAEGAVSLYPLKQHRLPSSSQHLGVPPPATSGQPFRLVTPDYLE